MAKKIVSICLLGTGLLLVIFGLVLCGVSASFVSDIEDMSGMDLSGSDVKALLSIGNSLMSGLSPYSNSYSNSGFAAEFGGGFQIFALYARGWFMWLGVLAVLAGLVLLAIDQDKQIVAVAWDLVKRVGLGIAAGFKAMFAGMANRPKKVKASAVQYSCPNCGAPYTPGAAFCSGCGNKLPDGMCAVCGTKNDPNARFCAGCGNALQ